MMMGHLPSSLERLLTTLSIITAATGLTTSAKKRKNKSKGYYVEKGEALNVKTVLST